MKRIIGVLLFTSYLLGQVTVPLSSPPPSGVNSVSANVGSVGVNTYVYHVIAQYPRGRGEGKSTTVVNAPVPSGANPIVINWTPQVGATYDILRTTSGGVPSSCTCALATGLTATTFIDNGGALSNYTLASGPPVANGSIYIDNQNFVQAEIILSPYLINVAGVQFPDGTQLLTATGASLQKTGNTNVFVSSSLTRTPGVCLEWDASLNAHDAASGLPCG